MIDYARRHRDAMLNDSMMSQLFEDWNTNRAAMRQQLASSSSLALQAAQAAGRQNVWEWSGQPKARRTLAGQIAWLRERNLYRGDVGCVHVYRNAETTKREGLK